MVETVPNQDPSQSLTWEDVEAVCKLMGVVCRYDKDFNDFTVYRLDTTYGATFSDPQDALEFLSAEQHPIEKRYANILRIQS